MATRDYSVVFYDVGERNVRVLKALLQRPSAAGFQFHLREAPPADIVVHDPSVASLPEGAVGRATLVLAESSNLQARPYQIARRQWLSMLVPALEVIAHHLNANAPAARPGGESLVPVRTILVVDDSATARLQLQTFLSQLGHRVLVATNGQEALAWVQSRRVDLVLLDINMEGMDGFDTCRAIRRLSHAKSTPVLMLTGRDRWFDHTRALMSGASGFLTKPVQTSELLEHLNKLVKT